MSKTIEERLNEAYVKKERLEEQLKAMSEHIKKLEKDKRMRQGENVIKKIEANGFSIEEILVLMENEKKQKKEGDN